MAIKALLSVLLAGRAHAQEKTLNPLGLVGCRCLNAVEIGAILNVSGSGSVLLPSPTSDVTNVSSVYGSFCHTWNMEIPYPSECARTDAPAYCSDRWCYVDACNCNEPDVNPTSYFNVDKDHYLKLGFSVRTCSEMTPTDSSDTYLQSRCSSKSQSECIDDAACKYVGSSCSPATATERLSAFGCLGKQASCPCINPAELNCVASQKGTVTFNAATSNACQVPSHFASACSAWDATPGMQFDIRCAEPNPPEWCGRAWCYVDRCNCDAVDLGISEYFKVDDSLKLGYSWLTCNPKGQGAAESYLRDVCNGLAAKGNESCRSNSKCEVSPSVNPNITNCTPRSPQVILEESRKPCGGIRSDTKSCTNTPPKPDPCRESESSAPGRLCLGEYAARFMIVAILAGLA